MFQKTFAIESANFFRNEGGIKSLLCKNIDVSLNHKEIGIYLKCSTPHPLSKILKLQYKVDISRRLCDGERKFLFKMKEGYKVSCVKILMFR